MNWKKLTIGISIINLFGWLMLELWSYRYASSNVDFGAGWLIGTQLVGYYIVVIASRIPSPTKSHTPEDCPGHDWQLSGYKEQQCIICNAKRKIE